MAKMETRETPDSKDPLDSKDPSALQVHQDHKEPLDASTRSTVLLAHKDLPAHQEPQERRDHLASMERTLAEDRVPQETMELQAHKELLDLKAHLDLKDQMASQAAANIAHHHELHQAIKLFLLLLCTGIDFFIHHHKKSTDKI